MTREIDWKKKDVWTHRESNFCVEISRHDGPKLDGTAENIWCVYAYVWNNHPAFALFKRDGRPSDQPYFEVHSYPSFYKPHMNKDGEVTSHQIGWDYNHDGDWHYLECETEDDAASVFWDAAGLANQLRNWGNED